MARSVGALALCLVFLSSARAGAERVILLLGAREAAEERVRLIAEAQREVNAAYFIVGDDPFSLTGLSLLRTAARRGLRVRLLVDAQWNKIPRRVQAHLIDEGVEIREYHPFRFYKPWWISRRLHDKLLVVDGEAMVVGGRNIESPYFDLGRQLERRNYLDADILVRGDSAGEAQDYFLELWDSEQVRRGKASAAADDLVAARRLLDEYEGWLNERIEEVLAAETSPRPLREAGPVVFLHDPIGRKGRDPGVAHALMELMDAAESSLLIETPYLVPSRAFKRALARALSRGVRVRILTNSLATTDNLLPQAGYVGHKKNLVRSSVELWEYGGPECLHSKVAVIDDRVLIVGSFNLDPRSEHLNTELAAVARAPFLVASMLDEMEAHIERSVLIDRNGKPVGSDRRYPGVSRWKVLKLRLLRLVAPFIKKQL